MRGILKKVSLNTYEVKKGDNKGKKFKKLNFEVEVTDEDTGEVRTFKGNMPEDYARKYFAYCGTTTKEQLGKEVEVRLAIRKFETDEGEERKYTFIKYMNFIDEEDEPIVMPKDDETSETINF